MVTDSTSITESLPALIATDLDGTFLSSDGTVSAENAAAVEEAAAAGIPVVFATGRPVRWLDVVSGLTGAHPVVVASNGAVLFDLANQTVLDAQRISVQIAADAVTRIREALPDVAFGVETGERAGYEEAYQLTARLDQPGAPHVTRGPVEELVAEGEFVKLLVQHPSMAADDLAAAITTVVGDMLTITHSAIGGFGLVEVSATGVSKASMLQRYCARLGIDAADVAAFGDMPNDLEMLSWVGRPYVMAGAHPELDALPATRIGSNDESAVGTTIRSWLVRAGRD